MAAPVEWPTLLARSPKSCEGCVVRCSARTGVGIDALGAALARALGERRAAETGGPVWLPVDRVFSKHGHGTIATGTLVRGTGTTVQFPITDTVRAIPVSYTGILPDLFREGQGVVAEGKLDATGRFLADTVLAKHDENYMPPEVAKALKAQGVWQGDAKAKDRVLK